MNDNLRQTKVRLTIIFSVIVFCLVLFLELIYFSGKYYKEVKYEKDDFNSVIDFIQESKIDINTLVSFQDRFKRNRIEKLKSIGLPPPETVEPVMKNIFKPQNFINFIIIDKNNKIVGSDIKDDISLDIVNLALLKDQFLKITQKSGLLVKKIIIEPSGHTVILFKKLRYSFDDYLEDLFGFVIISLLFSILLYIVGYQFVDRTLKPVEENIKDMKDFIHNVGHELKTPISVIDSNIQIIRDMKKYDKEMTLEMKKEVMRLNSLIDSLINLTNIDLHKDSVEINLQDILNEIIKDFKSRISEKNLDIEINVTKSVNVKANKDYFYMFLSNIIGNAIKYNKEKGKIEISYNKGELIIKDTGVGISKDDLPKIFDRFYKSDKSRNTDGFGIGLSLVKKIGGLYGWKIKIESEEDKYTKFIIKM